MRRSPEVLAVSVSPSSPPLTERSLKWTSLQLEQLLTNRAVSRQLLPASRLHLLHSVRNSKLSLIDSVWIVSDTVYQIHSIWYNVSGTMNQILCIRYCVSDIMYQRHSIWYNVSDTPYQIHSVCIRYSVSDTQYLIIRFHVTNTLFQILCISRNHLLLLL